MKLTLWDFQDKAEHDIRSNFLNGSNNCLFVLPTGAGKTVIFTDIAEKAASKNNRVLILVHRKELLEQASNKLSDFGVPHGLISPKRVQTNDLVQVASVDTLIRRLHRVPTPDLIICDEAHHLVKGNKWGKVVMYYDCLTLGVTATPMRYQGKGLGVEAGQLFDTMVLGPSIRWLIDNGYLSQPITYAPPNNLDLSNIKEQAGDYEKRGLQIAVDKAKITGDAVQHYKKICPGVPAVAFCISIKHAEEVAAEFNANGIPAMSIDGKLSGSARDYRIKSLADGRIKVLTSCEIISEGTDIPVITAAILLRPTKSLGLYMQQCGRALRIHPEKKESYILDHVGNAYNFGLVDSVRQWSLKGEDPKKRKNNNSEDTPKVRQCARCFFVYSIFKRECPNCGTPYQKTIREIEKEEGELQRISEQQAANQAKYEKKKEMASADSLEQLERIAKIRNYKRGWARHIWKARQEKKNKQLLEAENKKQAMAAQQSWV